MQFLGRGMIENNITELLITWVYNINNVNATTTCPFEIVSLLWQFLPCQCQKFGNLNAIARGTTCHLAETDFTIRIKLTLALRVKFSSGSFTFLQFCMLHFDEYVHILDNHAKNIRTKSLG